MAVTQARSNGTTPVGARPAGECDAASRASPYLRKTPTNGAVPSPHTPRQCRAMQPPQSTSPTGTRRLRLGRASLPNQIYHITTTTFRRKKIFADLFCGRCVVESLRRESQSGRCKTLCFVIMPDHLHWLMQVCEGGSLSTSVMNVKSHATRGITQLRGAGGRIWQRGFYDHAMRKDEDVLATARYIIANPLRARLVKNVGDYPLWDAKWIR
jgi:putative transposase